MIYIFLMIIALLAGCNSQDQGANNSPQPLICEDGNVAKDSSGAVVNYTGGMDGNDYIGKADMHCINDPTQEPPPGGGDESSAQNLVSDAQGVIGDSGSNTVANRSKENLSNQSAANASDGGFLNFFKPGGLASGLFGKAAGTDNSSNRTPAASGPLGLSSSGGSNDSKTSNGAGDDSNSLALDKESAADAQNRGAGKDSGTNKKDLEAFQGSAGPSDSSINGSHRMGVLESSGGGGAESAGFLDGISTNHALNLFEIVNRRYDRWSRSNF